MKTATPVYSIEDSFARLREHNAWYRPDAGMPEAGRSIAGINLVGFFRDESGWGAATRGYVRALQSLGIPLALRDLSELSSNRSNDATLSGFGAEQPYDTNLVCVDAGQHFTVMAQLGADFFEGRYNIGHWAWELPRFPERWYDRFAYYDEIWIASSFIANALSPISPGPVVRIPPVLTGKQPGSRRAGRERLGVAPDEHLFLFIFDVHSHLPRKNPEALVAAFRAAFRPGDRARLVLKCVNADSDPEGMTRIRRLANGLPIEIHDGYWTGAEMRDLMAACDTYVSLHRSEGTGLTITDAMAAGQPVIATGWSGNMDYMTVANSYPVRYRLVEIERNVGPYAAGEVWAEPSVEHAAELMRRVVEHPAEAAAFGEQARLDVEAAGSEGTVASLIRQRLKTITSRDRFPAYREELRRFNDAYQKLTGTNREAVERAVPEGSIIAVASRGDDTLLHLPGRTAWHFPRTREGVYAGYHPADSAAAIEHLESLRDQGARYFLLPGTSFWWLDHYTGFRDHLDRRYRLVWSDERCRIYDLHTARRVQ
jgi:glycosyltransferase involved in cell wall biosynthesis